MRYLVNTANKLQYALGMITATICLLCNHSAYATGINIISQEHSIWGFAGGQGLGETYDSYNITAGSPIVAEANGSYFFNPGEIEASHSKAKAGNFSIDLTAGRWAAEAYGTSNYIFTADHSSLFFYASGFTGQTDMSEKLHFSIFDENLQKGIYTFTFQALESTNGSENYSVFAFNFSDQFSVIPEHNYRLSMNAQALSGDSPTNSRLWLSLYSKPNDSAPLPPIPEPGTLLLVGLGLAFLASKRNAMPGEQ